MTGLVTKKMKCVKREILFKKWGLKVMIKNEYLKDLYMYGDRDIALNQLMKYFHMKDKGFIYSISTEYPCLEECTKDEIKFLTSASALIG